MKVVAEEEAIYFNDEELSSQQPDSRSSRRHPERRGVPATAVLGFPGKRCRDRRVLGSLVGLNPILFGIGLGPSVDPPSPSLLVPEVKPKSNQVDP